MNILKTAEFQKWFKKLSFTVRALITKRLLRVECGNLGDFKAVGNGVFEFRIHSGAGYRVYFGRDGDITVVLLIGGDKGSQQKDIEKAKEMWKCLTKKP